MEVAGRKAIVTGGVRGLGRAIVDALLARGATVAILDRDEPGLAELSSRDPRVHAIPCDVTETQQVVAATQRCHEILGPPDILVNNAGVLYSEPLIRIGESGFERHDFDTWSSTIAVDLSAVFYVTACVVERMATARNRGVVVNISSVAASGNPGQSAYSAAKAGVNALTAVWARELAPLKIRVVAVAPGYTETESTQKAVSPPLLREIIRRVPVGRLGRPDEIATGVMSVIENDFFNGKVIELDGGLIV